MEKVHCLPDELLARIDRIDRAGGRAGSVQLAELVAAFQIEHDEYEARQQQSEEAARDAARDQARPQSRALGSSRLRRR